MRAIAVSLLAVLAAIAAAAAMGNNLPPPHGTYVPMLVGNDIVREEFIRAFPMQDKRAGCIAILGDSRVAFNVNASMVVDSADANCIAGNYSFPGMGEAQFFRIMGELVDRKVRVKMVVLGVNDADFMIPKNPPSIKPSENGPAMVWDWQIRQWLMLHSVTRWVYLGHHRLVRFLKAKAGLSRQETDWTWEADLGRWRAPAAETRQMVRHDRWRESRTMASGYYQGRTLRRDADSVIKRLVAGMKVWVPRVVLILPPSDAAFQSVAEELEPGLRERFVAVVKAAAAQSSADVIDCSKPADCGLREEHFADPIHLNGEGAGAYTAALAEKIRKLESPNAH
jgi:hypothetical protein